MIGRYFDFEILPAGQRHRIYLAKAVGAAPPWTQDKDLLTYRFCNVFRELDKVTYRQIYDRSC